MLHLQFAPWQMATAVHCCKPRCVFDSSPLSAKQKRELNSLIGEVLLNCDAQLVAEDSALAAVVSMQPGVDCSSLMVTQYISCGKPLPLVRAQCGLGDAHCHLPPS
ncbi:hypothetical protein ABPG77_010302 [Micractinium sp. CCAP 211/92]